MRFERMVAIYRLKGKKSRQREQHVQRPSGWRPVLPEERDWVRMVNKGHVMRGLGGR